MVTRRRNGRRVGSLQRRVGELRRGVCSARTCGQLRELRTKHADEMMHANVATLAARGELDAYREDAPHVVTVLRAERSILRRVWFAARFVLFGFSRERELAGGRLTRGR
jgi:hypothetical protein